MEFLIFGVGIFPFLLAIIITSYSKIRKFRKRLILVIAYFCIVIYWNFTLFFFEPTNILVTAAIYMAIFTGEVGFITVFYKVYEKFWKKKFGRKKEDTNHESVSSHEDF